MAFLAVMLCTPNSLAAQDDNIVELASSNADLTILNAAINAADLASTLEGEGPFTVFAPTDEAFRALSPELFQALLKAENRQALVDILKFHVADGKLAASDVMDGINNATDGQLMAASMNGDLTATLVDEQVKLSDSKGNTATVIQADVMASNGVVHVIDKVLLPANIDVEALLSGKAMDMMDDAVDEGEEMVDSTKAMGNRVMEKGDRMAEQGREIADNMKATGNRVIDEGKEMVEDTKMAAQDMSRSTRTVGSNVGGTNSIVKVASGNDDFSTLVSAVEAGELVELLDGSESEFTVFAPTNDAFDKLPEGAVNDLTKPAMKDKLQGVLSYHVIASKISAADLTKAIDDNNGYFRIQTISGQSLIASVQDGNVVLTDGNGNVATVTGTDVMADNGIIHSIDTVLMPK